MNFRKDLPENSGSKNFLKLKDKESIEGIFRGELFEFFVQWKENKTKVVDEGAQDAKFRFRVNFVTKENGVYISKIFEQGVIVYRQLAELHAEYELPATVCKITRNGTGTDTTYSILPLLKKPITKEIMAHLETLELQDLGHGNAQNQTGAKSNAFNDDEIPF